MNNTETIINPFLNLLNYNSNNLYKDYKQVFIICSKTPTQINNDIYQYHIDKHIFNEIKKSLILVKTNINIVNNINHQNKLLVLSNTLLEEINIFNYTLTEKNIGLLILNITYDNILLYISQFEKNNKLEELFKFLTIGSYFNDDNTNINMYNKIEDLINFEDSNYWTYDYKCKLGLSEYFNNRNFIQNKPLQLLK